MKTYNKLAKYYDLIYSSKNYREEANLIAGLIFRNKRSWGRDLLDVACGTGRHLEYLRTRFSCMGLDSNPGMLQMARKNVRSVKFVRGNMMNFRLNRKFDAITCLFSAIGHLKNYSELERTMRNFSNHLKPGGIVIIEPWFADKFLKSNKPFMLTYDGDDMKIARVNNTKIRSDVAVMDFNYLIAEKDKPVKHYSETIKLKGFNVKKVIGVMESSGLRAKFLKQGLVSWSKRGLFIGVKK